MSFMMGFQQANLCQHLLVLNSLLMLVFTKLFLVKRGTTERKRIKWKHWSFLMENIVFAIHPIGKVLLI
jgi:hypothetical protein